MPAPRRRLPSDEEFEAILADPPSGGFSAWAAAQLVGIPYVRLLKAMRGKNVEVLDLGDVPRLMPRTVRQLREKVRGSRTDAEADTKVSIEKTASIEN